MYRKCLDILHNSAVITDTNEAIVNIWLRDYHLPICMDHLLYQLNGSQKPADAAAISSQDLLALGLQFCDIEWLTRGVLVRAVLKVCA